METLNYYSSDTTIGSLLFSNYIFEEIRRLMHFGHISLVLRVYNPVFFRNLANVLRGCCCLHCHTIQCSNVEKYLFNMQMLYLKHDRFYKEKNEHMKSNSPSSSKIESITKNLLVIQQQLIKDFEARAFKTKIDETSARDHGETKEGISLRGEIEQKSSARGVIQQESSAPGKIRERPSARDDIQQRILARGETKQVTSVRDELNESIMILENVKAAIDEGLVGVRQKGSAEYRQKKRIKKLKK
ncbi:unnamed protein product [Rotaria sp. Silwood2]|nr:unnamed protein product [Rotaria sp. Silwood2]CAF4359607.1 unnamed protein product [Rotaria sp. Silwood2]